MLRLFILYNRYLKITNSIDFLFTIKLIFGKIFVLVYSPIAQLAERIAVNDDVAGSSPARGANENGPLWWSLFVVCSRAGREPRKASGKLGFPLEKNIKNRGFLRASPI